MAVLPSIAVPARTHRRGWHLLAVVVSTICGVLVGICVADSGAAIVRFALTVSLMAIGGTELGRRKRRATLR